MSIPEIQEALQVYGRSYWADRCLNEIFYAAQVSAADNNKYQSVLDAATECAMNSLRNTKELSRETVLEIERMLFPLQKAARSYKLICVGHSHMDMNWEWNFSETVSIVLSTMRTMLNLMAEYPQFKYSQPQASVYRIIEEYQPEMLQEIKQYILEGRWEVDIGSWCEHDLNLPSEESQVRQIMYKQKYIEGLFGMKLPETCISFQPDSYGLSEHIPEIYAKCGIQYLYHVRCQEEEIIYNWEAPSGNSVLAYREPFWFDLYIHPEMVMYIPSYCKKYGIDTAMKVYGVCDHGGGPTRKDVEKILDMQTWPIFPEIRIGTFYEYFSYLEKYRENYPIVRAEMNMDMPGTYSTQSRIKAANKVSETKLFEAETISALCSQYYKKRYPAKQFQEAWIRTLFNQFHDILGGSGTIDAREYALGEFQKTLAVTDHSIAEAYTAISERINTKNLISRNPLSTLSTSEGAGVGFGIDCFEVPRVERGRGRERIFHVFNPSLYDRTDSVILEVWDWDGDTDKIRFMTYDAQAIPHQILTYDHKMTFKGMERPEKHIYWHHQYFRVLVKVTVPACGYTTLLLKEEADLSVPMSHGGWQTEFPSTYSDYYILENEKMRVVINKHNMKILSVTNKENETDLIQSKEGTCRFCYLEEEDWDYMSAWTMAPYTKMTDLHSSGQISNVTIGSGMMRSWLSYSIEYRNVRLNIMVSLDKNADYVDYNVQCEWLETAVKGKYIPRLQFLAELSYEAREFLCPVPMGITKRKGRDMDMSASGWIFASKGDDEPGCMLLTRNKYGFYGNHQTLGVTLLRSPYDPDPYPDLGSHDFSIRLAMINQNKPAILINKGLEFDHPLRYTSGTVHDGEMPCKASLISVLSDHIIVSSVSLSDLSGKLIIKAYNPTSEKDVLICHFPSAVLSVCRINYLEEELSGNGMTICDNSVQLPIEGYSLEEFCIELEEKK